MPSPYIADLIDHKQRVAGYMHIIARDIMRRAIVHDNSKFTAEEADAYEKAFPDLQRYAYGSAEFNEVLATIKPALQHHYAVNDHHPEHFENGIEGMGLSELIEMLCDWLAASERSQTPFYSGFERNKERFHIDNQLFTVLHNTVKWATPEKVLEKESDGMDR